MSGGMRLGIAVAGVAWLLTALPLAAQPLVSPTQDPLAGSRLFGDKGCSRCHAISGIGGRGGPDLGRIPQARSFFDLAAAMWNHLPGMAERMRQLGIARPLLDARETGDIIAFLFTLNYFDPPGDVQTGRRLFTEKKCVLCHQLGGVGGVVGPNLDGLAQSPSAIFVATAMWSHGPAMAEAMRARKIERPTFKDVELRDLIAYIRSASAAPEGPIYVLPGRSEEGERLFVQKRCAECHPVGGAGGVGPNLAERGRPRSLLQFAAAMWNKLPAMTAALASRGIPAPQLRPEEMADIVAYLRAVNYFGGQGEAQKGARVASEKGCLGCHTVRARDGKAPVELTRARGLDSPAAVIAALWNHSFVAAPPGARPKGPWPAFKPEEMTDLMSFLQSLSRPQ